MRVDKLVRDRVPEELRHRGRTIVVRAAAEEEYVDRLRQKLIEEATEVAHAAADEILEELADVLEVMLALVDTRGWSLDDLVETARQKREELGGFAGRTILVDNGA